MRGAKIEFYESAKDGRWYHRAKAANGKIVAHGGNCASYDACMFEITGLRKRAEMEVFHGTDGQWYFRVIDIVTTDVLAQSEGYTRRWNCEQGIKALQRILDKGPIIRAAR